MESHSVKAGLGFVVAMFAALGANAQESVLAGMDKLRNQVDANKRLVIEANLSLTESQAEAFWPIYDGYQTELKAINDRLLQLILDYAEAYNADAVSDDTARALMDEAIALDQAEVDLRKKSARRLRGVIPAKEAARYLQIESKIRAVLRFDIAEQVPLVE